MTCFSIDLSIDAALADPMIAAAMRADHVDPRNFERLLRSTARKLDDERRPKAIPLPQRAIQVLGAAKECALRW